MVHGSDFWHPHLSVSTLAPSLFWASIASLFIIHIAGVALCSARVHPLVGWQWVGLIVLEVFIAVSLLDWRLFSPH
jgi:hypothetical protein